MDAGARGALVRSMVFRHSAMDDMDAYKRNGAICQAMCRADGAVELIGRFLQSTRMGVDDKMLVIEQDLNGFSVVLQNGHVLPAGIAQIHAQRRVCVVAL